jgi:hypothetical protein
MIDLVWRDYVPIIEVLPQEGLHVSLRNLIGIGHIADGVNKPIQGTSAGFSTATAEPRFGRSFRRTKGLCLNPTADGPKHKLIFRELCLWGYSKSDHDRDASIGFCPFIRQPPGGPTGFFAASGSFKGSPPSSSRRRRRPSEFLDKFNNHAVNDLRLNFEHQRVTNW